MTKHTKETKYEKLFRVSRELETDESEENFNRILKKIAKSPPPKDDKPKKRTK